jgi:dihydrofolate reductase
MRKIINSTYITIDGVVDNPHLWPSPGDSKGQADMMQTELIEACDAMIMGRRTYESFAAVWPSRSGDRVSDRFNAMPKYAVSTTLERASWNNTTIIRRDVANEIKHLKEQPGRDIVQYGIGQLTYTMLEHGLLDEIRLWLYPLILGKSGPAIPHFRDCPPARFELRGTTSLPNGVVVMRYQVAK